MRYWDLGLTSGETMPLYRVCSVVGDACVPLEHPPIVDLLPGDEGYSPYGRVHWVRVPEGWSGRYTSLEAVQAAVDAGAIEAPEATTRYVHCPIAAEDAAMEVGPSATRPPETAIYVRGLEARCFHLSAARERPLLSGGVMIERNVYVLTREGEELPLVERMRMEDMTGDGDQADSNNVFGVDFLDADYTPLWRMVTVTVPADTASIDTSGDEDVAAIADAQQMFEVAPDYTITPIDGVALDHTITDALIDCPIQSAPGTL